MQIEIKEGLDLEKLIEKANLIHSITLESNIFHQKIELEGSFDVDLKVEWKLMKKGHRLISISGFFDIKSMGIFPLTIYRSGLIIGPRTLTENGLKAIKQTFPDKRRVNN